MLKKMIKESEKNGIKPPFFLLSNEKIDVSEFNGVILANFVLKELPKNTIYLFQINKLPYEYEWMSYTICTHGYNFQGECLECHKKERIRKLEWEEEDKRISGLLSRMRREGHKSLRDMLNHDCRK